MSANRDASRRNVCDSRRFKTQCATLQDAMSAIRDASRRNVCDSRRFKTPCPRFATLQDAINAVIRDASTRRRNARLRARARPTRELLAESSPLLPPPPSPPPLAGLRPPPPLPPPSESSRRAVPHPPSWRKAAPRSPLASRRAAAPLTSTPFLLSARTGSPGIPCAASLQGSGEGT
jgi:hypothetical protein